MRIARPKSKQPTPPDAQRVFKGVIFDIYQWKQKQFDGTKKTFEKIHRNDIVNILPITANNKIILSEQEQPGSQQFTGCLGGRIDDEEEPLVAAKRELREESGYTASKWTLWFTTQFFDEKIDCAIYTFIAKDLKQAPSNNLDAGEKIRLFEVTLDEYIDLSAKENYRDLEISLEFFRATRNQTKLNQLKQQFFNIK